MVKVCLGFRVLRLSGFRVFRVWGCGLTASGFRVFLHTFWRLELWSAAVVAAPSWQCQALVQAHGLLSRTSQPCSVKHGHDHDIWRPSEASHIMPLLLWLRSFCGAVRHRRRVGPCRCSRRNAHHARDLGPHCSANSRIGFEVVQGEGVKLKVQHQSIQGA